MVKKVHWIASRVNGDPFALHRDERQVLLRGVVRRLGRDAAPRTTTYRRVGGA
jgi:hypothetical protein